MKAAVVGSGPNGLTAACVLARAGWEVTVYEAAEAPGGALRSAEVLNEGVLSDLGASVHPFGAASPAFAELDLTSHGLEWVHPELPVAHGLDGEPPVFLPHALDDAVTHLGRDGRRWRRLIEPLADHWNSTISAALAPPLYGATHHLLSLMRLGVRGGWPATALGGLFGSPRTKALFAGLAGHSFLPLSQPLTGAFGLLFGAAAHTTGWPVARGGSQSIAEALVEVLQSHGGQVETGFRVETVRETALGVHRGPGRRGFRLEGRKLPGPGEARSRNPRGMRRSAEQVADVVLLNLTPKQMLELDGPSFPSRYRRALKRWRYGAGAVKIDYVLDGPVPWAHRELGQAGTVHLGGGMNQIRGAEAASPKGILPARPFVLVAQAGAADATRAPSGATPLWAYAHVPYGLEGRGVDRAAAAIENELQSQAPDFRDRILARKVWSPAELEAWNPNLVGGSLSGGAPSLSQFIARPALQPDPYATGQEGLYLCSSSAPPGGGAHGMAGYHAAQSVLREYGRP